jgi:hypothetical protein
MNDEQTRRGFVRNFDKIWPWFAAGLVVAIAFPSAAQTPTPQKRKKEPVQCIRDYNPVCTRTVNGVLTTFTNECTAKAAGAAILAKGKCDDLKCPPIELLVCGRKDGKTQTYANACLAEKEGAAILLRDKCPDSCTAGGAPVCAVDDKGKRAEYAGACQAVLAGARVLHSGKCVAGTACSGVGFRVCAISATGFETQYASECQAEAANASWIHNGNCKPGIFRRLLQSYGIVKSR